MSIENISISIDPSPLVSIVKTVIREELQPTLYGNDNTLAAVVVEEVANNTSIYHRIRDVVNEEIAGGSTFKAEVERVISDYTSKAVFDSTVKDIIHTEAERIVRDNLDYSDLAAEIDASDVAAYIKMSRLAAEINAGDIANEISCSDIANELSVSDIANEIDIENLADTIAEQHMTDVSETLAVKLDYKKLAAALLDVIAERSQPKPTV
jgi:hypothetical protein